VLSPPLADDPLEDRETEMASFSLLKIAHFYLEARINPGHAILFRQRAKEKE